MTKKKGGGKKILRGGQCQKTGAVVWQWVPTFKEAVPPPPPGTARLSGNCPSGGGGATWSQLGLDVCVKK